MTERDPYREHVGRQTERRHSIGPAIAAAGRLLTEGRRFTPIGIAVSIALPFVLVVGLLAWILGKDGLVQITSAWGESAEANKELAQQVAAGRAEVAALRADLAAYSSRTEATQKDVSLINYRLSLTCDLGAEQNGGRPREDWCGPPGQGTRFFPPSLGALTPHYLTHAPWTPPK